MSARQTWVKGWLVLGLLFGTAMYAIAEELTLTTYYPSPRGVYEELRTTDNTFLAYQAGNVGVGTASPMTKLHVQGSLLVDSGMGAIALGNNAAANYASQGTSAIALGNNARATGLSSLALGTLTTASGTGAVALGENVTASTLNAIVIGKGLTNGTANSLMVGFDTTTPALFVGPGDGAGATGNVGIGTVTVTPGAKLQVFETVGTVNTPDLVVTDVNNGAVAELEIQSLGDTPNERARLHFRNQSVAGGGMDWNIDQMTQTGQENTLRFTAVDAYGGARTPLTLTMGNSFGGSPQVGIGTTWPHTSAVLEINSTVKGVLLPRVTTSQRNAIATPAGGLLVYNTDTQGLETFDGVSAAWEPAVTGAAVVSPSVNNCSGVCDLGPISQWSACFLTGTIISGKPGVAGCAIRQDSGQWQVVAATNSAICSAQCIR